MRKPYFDLTRFKPFSAVPSAVREFWTKKSFSGGAGGARTHDPRISISASFIDFEGRNFCSGINNFKGFIDEKFIANRSVGKRLVHGKCTFSMGTSIRNRCFIGHF